MTRTNHENFPISIAYRNESLLTLFAQVTEEQVLHALGRLPAICIALLSLLKKTVSFVFDPDKIFGIPFDYCFPKFIQLCDRLANGLLWHCLRVL